MTDPETHARRLAADDPAGWFERLYVEAEQGDAVVPWDLGDPNRLLEPWARDLDGTGRRALVVGCGLGRDSEFIARRRFDTVAFDVSATAVEAARRRHPGSPVRYVRADLLAPPAEWHRAFDLVVESMTVQALPEGLHGQAISQVSRFVAPGGTLLVIALGYSDVLDGGPPWPLSRAEIDAFAADGLTTVRVEDLAEGDVHRWRAEFRLALT